MTDSVKQYIGILIDRIGDLTIENEVLRKMLREAQTAPVAKNWEQVLDAVMRSPAFHEKKLEFARRRDAMLSNLRRDEDIEAILKLPTHGLPN